MTAGNIKMELDSRWVQFQYHYPHAEPFADGETLNVFRLYQRISHFSETARECSAAVLVTAEIYEILICFLESIRMEDTYWRYRD